LVEIASPDMLWAIREEPMSFDELRLQYRAQDRWLDLAVLLEQHRRQVPEPVRTELRTELKELLEYMIGVGNHDAVSFAEGRLESLYREIGGDQALESLAGLYLDQSERQTDDLENYLKLRRKCAAIFESELNRPDAALLVLTSALGSDVLSSSDVLDDLERLGRATSDWDSIFEAIAPVLSQLRDDERSQPLLVRLGRWCLHFAGDEDQGVKLLERALERQPNDLAAIGLLEEHCRKRSDFGALAEILRFRADAGGDPPDRAAAWLDIAALAEGPLDDSALATEALENAFELAPDSAGFLRLEGAYRDAQRWPDVAVLLRSELARAPQGQDRQLNQRLAEVLARLGDVDDAIQEFRASSAGAKEFVATLKREAERAQGPVRARLLAEVARMYATELSDSLASNHYYSEALSLDSQLVDAAEPMVDIFLAEKSWDKAVPLLENLIRQGRLTRDPAWLHRRFVQLGQCCDRLGKPAPALQAFRDAYELNPRDTATVMGFGKLLFESKEWEHAIRIFGVLLKEHGERMQPAEVTGTHFMAARAFEGIGDEGRAIAAHQRVAELNPRHRESLRALVETFDRRKDWANFIRYADLLVVVEPEPLVRFRQLTKVGEVWATLLNRPDLAMVAYRAALDIDPKSIVVLRKLLDLYTRTEKYPLAVKVLERLIVGESQPARRATLHYTAGVLSRDCVGNEATAIEHFEAALDDDKDMLKSFEAIDRIFTNRRDWKELERSYRRMLNRVTPADTASAQRTERLLWDGLAEIYRSRLRNYELAIDAYKVLETLSQGDEKYRRILAELYEKMGDAGGALKEHRRLIAEDPKRVESFHVLHDAYLHTERFDAAWCVAGALSFLRSSTAHEESYYQKYLGRNLRLGQGVLTHEMYSRLNHSSQDSIVSALLSYAAEGLRAIYGVPIRAHGIDPKRAHIHAEANVVFRQIWTYVAQCLAMPSAPDLFETKTPGVVNLNGETPSVGVGPDRLESQNDRESAFYAAKLAYAMRPENYLGSIFPAETLQTMLMAVLDAADPSFGYTKQYRDANFERAVKELRKIPEPLKAPLRSLVAKFKQRGASVDIPGWLNAMEHSSNRAGLLLCGEFATAASCVRYGSLAFGNLGHEARIRELLLFSIDETYFGLREHLQLAIGGSRPF